MTSGYLSEVLYHFFPDFEVFTSIVKRGLLCSQGNKRKLDRFAVTLKEEGVKYFEVWQHPRVCFTDIPEESTWVLTPRIMESVPWAFHGRRF